VKTEVLIKRLKKLEQDTKLLRPKAIAILRGLDDKTLASLEDNTDVNGYSRVVRKVHGYPSDLSLIRLIRLLEALDG